MDSDEARPHLFIFEHTEGSKVYKQLFPGESAFMSKACDNHSLLFDMLPRCADYTLPNGKKARRLPNAHVSPGSRPKACKGAWCLHTT